jgi:hypothetical protein
MRPKNQSKKPIEHSLRFMRRMASLPIWADDEGTRPTNHCREPGEARGGVVVERGSPPATLRRGGERSGLTFRTIPPLFVVTNGR